MKSLIALAIVGYANATVDLDHTDVYTHTGTLMAIGKYEGTYFQDDEGEDDDAMWWWNGWYNGAAKLYYGYKWSATAPTTANSAVIGNGANVGLWIEYVWTLKNEFFSWYWNSLKFKFIGLDAHVDFDFTSPFYPVFVDSVGTMTGSGNNDSWCFSTGYTFNALKVKTRVNQNVKVCRESLMQLYDRDFEFEPKCGYEENMESEFWDGFLTYDIIKDLLDTELDVINVSSWYGEQFWWGT
jgi:hypothetical protein